ncbi:toxin-antitoxin system YwqK family antitoxin [Streptomyces sp. NPDC001571]
MSATRRIDIDSAEVDMDDAQRLLYQGELFTGEAAEYMAGAMVSLDNYTDGVQDGSSREWYPDGSPRSEGQLREGLPHGEFKEWHANGVLASRKLFGDDGLTLLEEFTWDENGQPTRSWRLDND